MKRRFRILLPFDVFENVWRSVEFWKSSLTTSLTCWKKKQNNTDKVANKEDSSPQQDNDADFFKRGKQKYYSYKAHIGVDESSGIIRKGSFTSASVHDSQEFDKLICGNEVHLFFCMIYNVRRGLAIISA